MAYKINLMERYANRLIYIFTNIMENIRNERKNEEKTKYQQITYISAAHYSRLPKLVLN